MFGEYKNSCGRPLLKEMRENSEESIMYLCDLIENFYPQLLSRESLRHSEIRQYNALVNANVDNIKVKQAIRER